MGSKVRNPLFLKLNCKKNLYKEIIVSTNWYKASLNPFGAYCVLIDKSFLIRISYV